MSQFIFFTSQRLAAIPLALSLACSAWSQQAPDAGRILQEQQLPLLTLPAQPAHTPLLQPAASEPNAPGGTQVKLRGVEFVGNTAFADAVLQEVLGPVSGQSLDLRGLQRLADRVTAFYREAGYPLSRALLPAQNLSEGVLRIAVVEARYGKVQASVGGEADPQAQAFLSLLQPGGLIESGPLERSVRILGEQPGVKVSSATMRTGQEASTGDLDVRVERGQLVRGDVGFDNYGNRYTGEFGARLGLQLDSPFMLGDQITLQLSRSDEQLWFGQLGYSLPLGVAGWRGNVGLARTSYRLAKDFASLDAGGTAEMASAGITYALLRTQDANWTIGLSYEHKRLHDQRASFGMDDHKSVDALPVLLQFDGRDKWAGGGVSYGTIGWTPGKLNLDEGLTGSDQSSGRQAQGRFNKLMVNVARLQATALEGVTLHGRVLAQWADKNLDSSEKLSLGGANGVRAYPVGEGMGDNGWLAQLEIRYAMGAFTPFVFYDAGCVQLNARSETITPAVSQNHRAVAGAGAGARYSAGALTSDLSVAWRTHGGTPEADPARSDPRVWLRVAYRF